MFLIPSYLFVGGIIIFSLFSIAFVVEKVCIQCSLLTRILGIKFAAINSSTHFYLSKKHLAYFHKLKSDYVSIDKGQIPLVAYLIVQGKARIFHSNKKITELGPGAMIGANEVIHNMPFNYKVVFEKGCNIGAIGKSQLLGHCT
ncbi:MAG: hypothetical protein HOE90_09980 [Bacteriovoracaceae bacterium]|jgi:hypothetical protein|nr:hypothetical protein [Bacteriovoracaceae bacterium]